MPKHVLYIAVPLILLLVSVYFFLVELISRRLQNKGIDARAFVVRVDYIIAHGLRNFLRLDSKQQAQEHTVRCDYILTLQYAPQDGTTRSVQTTVPAHLRVSEGKKLPFFKAGDVVKIRYRKHFPRLLVVLLDGNIRQHKTPFPLFLWGACIILLAAILVISVLQFIP